MGAYEYQALDQRGRTRKGVINADTARQVRQQLREQELTPLQVAAVSETRSKTLAGDKVSRSKVNATELAVITRQFATLLSSGMTIEDSLNALTQQSEGHSTKSILSGIRSMVMEGHSLADSLRAFPRSFPDMYTSSVYAGEQTGRLPEVLERLADYTETRLGIKQRIGVALVYPVILTAVAIAIVIGLLAYVVPKVVKVFADTGQELPALTRGLIAVSEFLQTWGLELLVLFIGGGLILGLYFRRPKPRYWLHELFLRLPGIRRLSRGVNTARMARTLAIMVGSGVPLLSAIEASTGVISNVVLQNALHAAGNEVIEGASFNRALGRSGRFPPLLVQMVASGESSGTLDSMLDKAAASMERELEARVAILVGLFEPFMILFMGGVVLTIVLAILLPIFDINQIIQ